jgi:hypothetical protein
MANAFRPACENLRGQCPNIFIGRTVPVSSAVGNDSMLLKKPEGSPCLKKGGNRRIRFPLDTRRALIIHIGHS